MEGTMIYLILLGAPCWFFKTKETLDSFPKEKKYLEAATDGEKTKTKTWELQNH